MPEASTPDPQKPQDAPVPLKNASTIAFQELGFFVYIDMGSEIVVRMMNLVAAAVLCGILLVLTALLLTAIVA